MEYNVLEAICIKENLLDKLSPEEAYYVEMWQRGFSSIRLAYYSGEDIKDYLCDSLIELFDTERY